MKSGWETVGRHGLAFAAASFVALGGSALAQDGGKDTPWVKICNTDPKTKKEICLITQELRTNTGQFLTSVAIRELGGEARKTLLVAVPSGMLLQPGLRIQVDKNKAETAKYSICFPNACYAELVINDTLINTMKKGSDLTITALNQQAKPVPFKMSLSGFTATYDGDPVDAAQLKKKQEELQAELQKRAEEARQKLIEEQKKASEAANQ
ncbi:MAG: invasion associated locus B family protein [Hyphomicrobiales bacterium]|nr:MAG: invasion associated locus B family protein [Hyphomicrobiales bacterium]